MVNERAPPRYTMMFDVRCAHIEAKLFNCLFDTIVIGKVKENKITIALSARILTVVILFVNTPCTSSLYYVCVLFLFLTRHSEFI